MPVDSSYYINRLKDIGTLSDYALIPAGSYPNYLAMMRKKYGVGSNVDLQNLPLGITGGTTTTGSTAVGRYGNKYGPSNTGVFGTKGKSLGTNYTTSFWDTGGSGHGDTGAPAGGSKMQFSMVASPYLPMGTRLRLTKNGKVVNAFVGDMGPGAGVHSNPNGGGNLPMIDLSDPMAGWLVGKSPNWAINNAGTTVKADVVSWGTGATLYKNAATARKYRSMYSSLKHTSPIVDRATGNSWNPQVAKSYLNWNMGSGGNFNANPIAGAVVNTSVPTLSTGAGSAQILKPGAKGIDYAWTHVNTGGSKFAMRYLSNSPSKNLTRAEAIKLGRKGVGVGVVWETSANRAGAGYGAGIADAKRALKQANRIGMPSDRPIYFAVDFDTNGHHVSDYFKGVNKVLGANRVGVYGGYRTVKDLHQMGLAKYLWQTLAWSGGKWYKGNHIEQYNVGNNSDPNRARQSDIGTWIAR